LHGRYGERPTDGKKENQNFHIDHERMEIQPSVPGGVAFLFKME
jgi:hypothetical protein